MNNEEAIAKLVKICLKQSNEIEDLQKQVKANKESLVIPKLLNIEDVNTMKEINAMYAMYNFVIRQWKQMLPLQQTVEATRSDEDKKFMNDFIAFNEAQQLVAQAANDTKIYLSPVPKSPLPIPPTLEHSFPADDVEQTFTPDDASVFDMMEQSTKDILSHRIKLHKELGSYVGPIDVVSIDTSIEQPAKEEKQDYPMINPLLKFCPSEQKNILKNIFDKAMHNVTVLLNVSEDSADFEVEFNKEMDRLLSVWTQINQ